MNKITVLNDRDQRSMSKMKANNNSQFPVVMEFLVEDAVEIADEEIEKQLYNMMRDYRYLGFGFDATDFELKELISKSKVAIGFEAGVKAIWEYIKQRIQNQ